MPKSKSVNLPPRRVILGHLNPVTYTHRREEDVRPGGRRRQPVERQPAPESCHTSPFHPAWPRSTHPDTRASCSSVGLQTAVASPAVELRPGEPSADRRRGFVYDRPARLLMNSVGPDWESTLLGPEQGECGRKTCGWREVRGSR